MVTGTNGTIVDVQYLIVYVSSVAHELKKNWKNFTLFVRVPSLIFILLIKITNCVLDNC